MIVDCDRQDFLQILQAASESDWMPDGYTRNHWIPDVCRFLRHGPAVFVAAVDQGNAKPSACCPGEHLVPMHSTDTKLCTGCKTEKHWPLEPGQKRTY